MSSGEGEGKGEKQKSSILVTNFPEIVAEIRRLLLADLKPGGGKRKKGATVPSTCFLIGGENSPLPLHRGKIKKRRRRGERKGRRAKREQVASRGRWFLRDSRSMAWRTGGKRREGEKGGGGEVIVARFFLSQGKQISISCRRPRQKKRREGKEKGGRENGEPETVLRRSLLSLLLRRLYPADVLFVPARERKKKKGRGRSASSC